MPQMVPLQGKKIHYNLLPAIPDEVEGSGVMSDMTKIICRENLEKLLFGQNLKRVVTCNMGILEQERLHPQ